MGEEKRELLEGVELTDEMLEGISGGNELTKHIRLSLQNLITQLKGEGKTIEQAEEVLSTKTTLRFQPAHLRDVIDYMHEIW